MKHQGQFLFPPRPLTEIVPKHIPLYERDGWTAQVKKNGECLVISTNGRSLKTWTRKGTEPKRWLPSKASHALSDVRGCVFACEALDHKRGGPKGVLYVFDVVAANGRLLYGTTYKERSGILQALFPKAKKKEDRYEVSRYLWIARNLDKNLLDVFNRLDSPEDEGLVLRQPLARLAPCNGRKSNGGWLVKVKRKDQ